MYIHNGDLSALSAWIVDELALADVLEPGAAGSSVARVQEWLTLAGYPLRIDAEFGPRTQAALTGFQDRSDLDGDGRVDPATFQRLTATMYTATRQLPVADVRFGGVVCAYAEAHLAAAPREVGGQNRGPWVRLYMKGQDGQQWPWCAGFASFVMHQAAQSLGLAPPIDGSFSCDELVAQARRAGLFVAEDAAQGRPVPPGSFFLNRRSDTDWVHVGIVSAAHAHGIDTIEGNTNDEGAREGFEVCRRTRSYAGRDFIVLDGGLGTA